MGLTAEQLRSSLDELCRVEPAFAAARARIGDPEPRIRPPGFETMVRAIVGQQVSTKAAAAILAVVVGWMRAETRNEAREDRRAGDELTRIRIRERRLAERLAEERGEAGR